MDKDNFLLKKIVKYKKLQKLSQSCLALVVPKSWLNAMNWTSDTHFICEIHPLRKEIIFTENEEISNSQPSEHNES